MKKKVAIFKTNSYFETPCFDDCTPSDFVRLTEFVEIDFPEREKAEQITDEVNYINEEIFTIREETIKKINDLSVRKEELLALEVSN